MKNTFMVIPLVFLTCLIVGCQQGAEVVEQPVVDVEADIQAIKDIVAEWETANNNADLDKLMSNFADDAVAIPPNEPPSIRKEAIQRSAQKMFEEMSPQEKDVVQDVQVSGNMAVAHVTWSALITSKAGGEPSKHSGNWIIAFEKQSDSTWKIIYSIWSDESLVSPTQAE